MLNEEDKKVDGKFLEAITASIEKALVKNISTSIHRNYKVHDRDGIQREIDVYCETLVNGKRLKYGLECKEYKSGKVQLKHIVDFYSKIDTNGIKGIMVTTSGYTKNTKKKARSLGIDLYQIKENTNPEIKKVTIVQQMFEIFRIEIEDKYFKSLKGFELDYVYKGIDKKSIPFAEFKSDFKIGIGLDVIMQHKTRIFNRLIEFSNSELKFEIGKKTPYQFYISVFGLFYKYMDEFVEIEKIYMVADFWLEKSEQPNPDSFVYFDISNNVEIANFFSKNVTLLNGVEGYMNIIKPTSDNKKSMQFVTKDPRQQKHIRTYDFGVYKADEISITFNEEE